MDKKEKFLADIKYIISETGKAFVKYIKGLIIIFLLNILVLSIGFKLLGQNLWFLLALIVAIIDLIPIFGSGMILVPWVLLEAFNQNLSLAAWIGLIYVSIIVIRLVAEPLIIGKSVGISPLISIAVTIIGSWIFGPLGAVIATILVIPIKIIWNLIGDKSIFQNSFNRLKAKIYSRTK